MPEDNFYSRMAEAMNQQDSSVNATTTDPVVDDAPPAVDTVDTTDVPPTTPDPITPPVNDAPPADAPVAPTEPVVNEKIIEKIVEKYPEIKSARAKELYDRIVNSDDSEAEAAFVEYVTEKKRDYKTMSDFDVVRTKLGKDNPQWSNDEVELEMRVKYGDELQKLDLASIDKDEDPDAYEKAVAHNKIVENNLRLLQRDARDDRYSLIEDQKSLELPKIKNDAPAPDTVQQPTAEEIEQKNREWAQQVEESTKALSDHKVQIGDKEVSYQYTPEDNQAAVEAVRNFNIAEFFKANGWVDENEKPNPLKMAEDMRFLRNREKVERSFYTQGETAGKKAAMADIKNIQPPNTASPASTATSFADAFAEAAEAGNSRR